MWDYMKQHEAYVRAALAGEACELTWEELWAFHERQIQRMQHERLIHLIVTMFVALFFLLSIGFVSVVVTLPGATLAALFIVLTAAYIVHYFRLENGVQRWYALANELDTRRRG